MGRKIVVRELDHIADMDLDASGGKGESFDVDMLDGGNARLSMR